MARMSEAQLGLLGWGPDGGPKRAPDARPPTAASPPAVPRPSVDPDGFDFVNVVYRGAITGWQRPRTGKGRTAVFHNSERHQEGLLTWKALLRQGCIPGVPPIDFSLQMLLEIRYPVPGSWSKKRQAEARAGRIRPSRRPDVSNILKLIEDAGNVVAWRDDQQFDSYVIERVYAADAPAIWLRVRRAPIALPWSSPT